MNSNDAPDEDTRQGDVRRCSLRGCESGAAPRRRQDRHLAALSAERSNHARDAASPERAFYPLGEETGREDHETSRSLYFLLNQ